jgi:hypothetical protein
VSNIEEDVKVNKDVPEQLTEQGIPLTSVSAIICSHSHIDHVGDPSVFPSSVDLVLGPSFKSEHMPGYPTNPQGLLLDRLISLPVISLSVAFALLITSGTQVSICSKLLVTLRIIFAVLHARLKIPSFFSAPAHATIRANFVHPHISLSLKEYLLIPHNQFQALGNNTPSRPPSSRRYCHNRKIRNHSIVSMRSHMMILPAQKIH